MGYRQGEYAQPKRLERGLPQHRDGSGRCGEAKRLELLRVAALSVAAPSGCTDQSQTRFDLAARWSRMYVNGGGKGGRVGDM
jgi:hypothetical protein